MAANQIWLRSIRNVSVPIPYSCGGRSAKTQVLCKFIERYSFYNLNRIALKFAYIQEALWMFYCSLQGSEKRSLQIFKILLNGYKYKLLNLE